MIGRLVRSADFERVLRSPTRARSAHFAVHHVAGWPSTPAKPLAKPGPTELSTDCVPVGPGSVDDCPRAVPAKPTHGPRPGALWLAAVVPKRHARRSVTRSLIKRQIRSVMAGHEASLACGMWVVRLRQPFERTRFPSAASLELKSAVRSELVELLATSVRHTPLA